MPPCRSPRSTNSRSDPISRPGTPSQSRREAEEEMALMQELQREVAARAAANAAAASTNAMASIATGAPPSPPPERPLPPLPPHARVPSHQPISATAEITTGEDVLFGPVSLEAALAGSWVVNRMPRSPQQPQSGGPSSESQGRQPKATYRLKYRRDSHTTLDADEHERHEFVPAAYFPSVQFDRILYWEPSMGCVLRGGHYLNVYSTMSWGDGGIVVDAGESVAIFNTMARLVSMRTIQEEEDEFMGWGGDDDDYGYEDEEDDGDEDEGDFDEFLNEGGIERDIYGNDIEESDDADEDFYAEELL